MNLFNRAVVILLLVVIVAAGIILLVFPEALLASLQNWTSGAVVTPQDRVASAILGVVLVLFSVGALYVELRTERRKTVVISRLADGTAALEVPSIAQRIRQEVEALDGVRQANALVTSRGKNVDIRLVVLIAPEVDVPAKGGEIGEVVRRATEKMGVGMGKQVINLRHDIGTSKAMQRN